MMNDETGKEKFNGLSDQYLLRFQFFFLMDGGRAWRRRLLSKRRSVVVDHAPTFRGFFEDIGRENGGGNVLSLEGTVQVFVKRHPGEIAAHLHGDIGQHETDRWSVVENPPPAFHD